MTRIIDIPTTDLFVPEIEAVKEIGSIPTMLEVICRITGMRFAAVARVTEDRWIACSVRDNIAFGLRPGSELKVQTTICNKIRASRQPVLFGDLTEIDNDDYLQVAKRYGFRSYISFPIFLKTGEFFGTLCAIDPNPANLNNPQTIGLFRLFSELIAYQLQEIALRDEAYSAVRDAAGRLDGPHFSSTLS